MLRQHPSATVTGLLSLSLSSALSLTACDPGDGEQTSTEPAGESASDGVESDGVDPEPQQFEACEMEFTITEPSPNYPWTPNAVQLVSEQLHPGVFAVYDANADAFAPEGIPLATSAGFVIGDQGVVLIETMINRQLLCQLVGLVREQTDAPILYAINTSYHGDHSYGNAFLPPEIEVVQHERTADYIAQNFEDDIVFMTTNFGADQGLDEITPVVPDIAVDDGGWSVDLGGLTVEANYFGFGQTEGDLFVYVPQAQVMWTGNPLIAEAPAIPWLLDGQPQQIEQTLADVQASLPPGAIVVPGHGRPVAPADFDFSIDYLDALVDGVAAAHEAGLSEEETVAAVTLEPFQGYALWGWVHAVLNVPVTYAELAP
ncbi:MAG: MBL fold metallo-hydrolase [Nannocystaceae bacterium]